MSTAAAREGGRRALLALATLASAGVVVYRALGGAGGTVVSATCKGAPALVLALVGLTAPSGANPRGKVFANRVGVGMALSALGDVVLESENGFLPGLCFFLLAHLAYGAAFNVDTTAGQRARLGTVKVWLGRFFILFWGALLLAAYGFLRRGIPDELEYPVAAYVAVIGVMVYRAAARHEPSCGAESYYSATIGAVFFAASDFLLAYDRFVRHLDAARYLVLFLYYIGQIGIANSTIFPEYKPPSAPAKSAGGAATTAKSKPASSTASAKSGKKGARKRR